jgi:DNA replication protein DnaC
MFDVQVKNHTLKGAKLDGSGHFLDRYDMDWSDIVLSAGVREKFEREILDMFACSTYTCPWRSSKGGFALLGPPGTGKTNW